MKESREAGGKEGEREQGKAHLARMGSGSQEPAPNLHVPPVNHAPQGEKFCEALVSREAGETAVF